MQGHFHYNDKTQKLQGLWFIRCPYVGPPVVLKGPFDKQQICHSVNWEHEGHKAEMKFQPA